MDVYIGPEPNRHLPGEVYTGAMISQTVAATSVTAWDTPANTPFYLKRAHIRNRWTDAVWVLFGETVAAVFTQRQPGIRVLSGFDRMVGEDEMPRWLYQTDLISRVDAAGVIPNDVEIQVEVRAVTN